MYRSFAICLGAGLCLSVLPAAAQDRELVHERVKLNDLNLNSAAGLRTARGRIDGAARAACRDTGPSNSISNTDRERCRDEVRRSGEARIGEIQYQYRLAEQQRIAAERAQLQRQARRATPTRATRATRSGTRYRHCTWPKKYAYKKRVCVWRYRR